MLSRLSSNTFNGSDWAAIACRTKDLCRNEWIVPEDAAPSEGKVEASCVKLEGKPDTKSITRSENGSSLPDVVMRGHAR